MSVSQANYQIAQLFQNISRTNPEFTSTDFYQGVGESVVRLLHKACQICLQKDYARAVDLFEAVRTLAWEKIHSGT